MDVVSLEVVVLHLGRIQPKRQDDVKSRPSAEDER